MKSRILRFLLGGCLAVAPVFSLSAQSLTELQRGFQNPPQGARTQVWWHWMNGNITKDGIRKDLLWMHHIGLGGFHNFDAGMTTPQVVKNRLIYMHDDWKDAFAYATHLADSLGLSMTIASAPGWSSTGGPWVAPKDGMKKLVWKTVQVKGGKKIAIQLPEGSKATGAYQDLEVAGRGEGSVVQYYEDICVLAVRLAGIDKTMQEIGATVSSSAGNFTVAQLTDGILREKTLLPKSEQGDSWIMYTFPQAQTIRSMELSCSGNVELESSQDGTHFTKVCPVRGGSKFAHVTIDIPETTARYFRLVIPNRPAPAGMFGPAPVSKGAEIAEWILSPSTRVNRAEDKAAFTAGGNLAQSPTSVFVGEEFVSTSEVIDVTSFVDATGKLTWKAPKGNWRIYRFGFSLTGKQNHPAPPEATGLEVDKMDPKAWSEYVHHYLDMYKEASKGQIGQKGIQYVLTDSYEAEQETWTPAMFQEFKTRRGYDLKPWLPVLAGVVIGTPEQSDAFLRDWRLTVGELMADNYTLLSKIAREDYGMKGRYTESHEGGRAFVGDGMDLKATAEVPMSAMWCGAPWLPVNPDGSCNTVVYQMDDKESASVAHIYGQNVAAAESMTAWGKEAYTYDPAKLKMTADLELANGINRFVIHESAHQPLDDKVPGMSLGGIGQWFNRHETWAEQAKVWVDYMSRSSYMLQQGKNVADILLYYGEDGNITSTYNAMKAPEMPAGYQYDFCSPQVLTQVLEAQNDKLVSKKSGVSYRLLWLDKNMDYVSLPVLRKIAELAKAGVWIGGQKPQHPAGAMESLEEFNQLLAEIYEGGHAHVSAGVPMADILKQMELTPDVIAPEGIRYLHRTLTDGEIYWINKPAKDNATVKICMRTQGRKPMLWHPETGKMEEVTYTMEGGRTQVYIPMVPEDAVFVVLMEKTDQKSLTLLEKTERTLLTVQTPWNVKFQEGRGAPASAVFNQLADWTQNEDAGIKYFSGTATYTNTINLKKVEGKQQILKLGNVKNLAEVIVNGQSLGIVWKEPYQMDVTSALKAGDNTIEIRVTNLWVNRLIGDLQPGAQKITFTDSQPSYKADSPLLPSGLMGPVELVAEE